MTLSTRDKLAWEAARLFQIRGFHGVGLTEVLTATGLPKGSLYHHFPNGKSDLALAAADLAHREMIRIIDESFSNNPTFDDGVTTLFHKLAKLFDMMGKYSGCPISHILFSGPDQVEFKSKTAECFESWISLIASHAVRSGWSQQRARKKAEHIFAVLQGGWTLARANSDSEVLRNFPKLLVDE